MTRTAITSVIAFIALPAAADYCDPSWMDCSPLVACIHETGERFSGAGFGRDGGVLQVTSNLGSICSGKWKCGPFGIGIAEFHCDDGRIGSSVFAWFEPVTGTAVGNGEFANGPKVKFWTGNNLQAYFDSREPGEITQMACAPADMLLG